MPKDKNKVTFISRTTTVSEVNGEEIEKVTEETKTIALSAEPPFVKLYLDTVLSIKNLSKSLSPILIGFLKFMSYASSSEGDGGQVIYTNAAMKREIAAKAGVSMKRIDQALSDFVKGGVFRRIDLGTYQVNANLFGRGEWKDIKNIRTKIDWRENSIESVFDRSEEGDAGKFHFVK
jgi:hypothetical protein